MQVPACFKVIDMLTQLENAGVGLELDQETSLNILIYADDIVLLAENELDLQFLLF